MKLLYVVGIGPGCEEFLTAEAKEALENSEVICGYTVYIELIRNLCAGKMLLSTPMRKEIDRCHLALQSAAAGRTTAMVCSGDAGVYGMAAPILQLSVKYPEVKIQVISGVTAALSGAAVLGAPLSHDFAVISLSDLLTPWERIIARLRAAASADFAIVLYNPASRKRADYLQKAVDCMLEYKEPQTVCGVVRNIGREGQCFDIMTLGALRAYPADMFTTVFIGNRETFAADGRMITPRGYGMDV